MEEYGGKQADIWIWSTDLEVRQNGMGRLLWDVGNVRSKLIRGETGWSTFEERSNGEMDVESGV